MPKEKRFVLKKEFPGGYKKGDVVSDRGTGVWYWERTAVPCQYDPSKETSFFAPHIESEFERGDLVRLTPAGIRMFGTRNKVGEKTDFTVVAAALVNNKFIYTIAQGSKRISQVGENHITKPQFYWFVNSSGKVCKDVVAKTFAYDYRVFTGNTFRTCAIANEHLEQIKKSLKK